MSKARLAYAQARAQARYADRPGPSAWAGLEPIQDPGRYLQQADAVGLGRFVEKLGPNSSAHAVEISLRECFRRYVGEIADWMPKPWFEAVRWCALLMDLEPLRRLSDGETLPGWMHDDPFLARLIDNDDAWPLPELGSAGDRPPRFADRWRTVWRRYRVGDAANMERLDGVLPMSSWDPAALQRLDRVFRQCAGRPAAVFAFVGLVLSDVLRLRGALLKRIEFVGGRA